MKWNSLVPRLGISYDLLGNGKTVLKANYGIYKFNPGVGVAGEREPEPVVEERHLHLDRHGCATASTATAFQPGEEGNVDARARWRAAISVDPNLKQPYSTQATAYLEQQITEGVGARVGFVYYSVSNQTGTFQPNRPASAPTRVPFNVVDKGPDSITGTADDQNLTVLRHPDRADQRLHASVTTPTADLSRIRRTRCSERAEQRQLQDRRVLAEQAPEPQLLARRRLRLHLAARLPAAATRTRRTVRSTTTSATYSFKINGTYNAPWGINISPVLPLPGGRELRAHARPGRLRHPAPAPSARRAAAQLGRTPTVYADAVQRRQRQDNISVLDLRVEKTVNLGPAAKVRLFLDGFNMLNSYAAETLTVSTGNLYLQPTAILGPRTGRVGVRFIW